MMKLKPCPKCGSPVEVKWIAGTNVNSVLMFSHPFNGRPSWYIHCVECGNSMDMPVTKPSAREQQLVKNRLIKRWNNQ